MPTPGPLAKVNPLTAGAQDPESCVHATLKSLGKIDVGEKSGAILKSPDGKYYNTDPVDSDHNNFNMRVHVPKGWSIAGLYHSHPGDDDMAQYFSPNDINVANQLKVPSYIRFSKDDSIRKYVPGQTQLQNVPHVGDKFGMKITRGDEVKDPAPPQQQSTPEQSAALQVFYPGQQNGQ